MRKLSKVIIIDQTFAHPTEYVYFTIFVYWLKKVELLIFLM